MASLRNSIWYAAHPFSVQAPSYSAEIPTQILDAVTDPVLTHIEVTGGELLVGLDGLPLTPTSYDYKLVPIPAGSTRYVFETSPDLIQTLSVGGSAQYKIGYEAGLISAYPFYRPLSKEFAAAPLTSAGINASGLISNSVNTYATVIQVKGGYPLYVTLDGRTATFSDYDRALDQNVGEGPQSAYVFNVDPNKIRIMGQSGVTVKIALVEYAALAAGDWRDNPIYDSQRGWR